MIALDLFPRFSDLFANDVHVMTLDDEFDRLALARASFDGPRTHPQREFDRDPLFAWLWRTAQRLSVPANQGGGMATPARTSVSRADWRTRWAAPPRTAYTTETKPFFLTSEFVLYVLYEMGLGIAASTSPSIDARLFWILTTVATGLYMLSRGIAKAGSRSRAYDPRDDIEVGRDND